MPERRPAELMPGIQPQAIVVGAGIAGTAAALELATAGISFVGIERAAEPGGTARRGGIGTSIAGSPYQRQMGIDDNWELAVADLRAEGNDPDPAWSRFYYRRAVADVYGWFDGLGVTFDRVTRHEGDSAARWHLPLGAGVRVMDAAWQKLAALGGADGWRFGVSVRDLLRDGDKVVGVRVEDANGKRADMVGGAVLLAVGGFAGNAQMGRRASPRFAGVERFLAGGNPDSQGELHRIVERHGGLLDKMQDVYAYANATPDYRDPSGVRGVVVRGIRNCIWVNREARRFHDEDLYITGRSAVDDLLKQPGQTCWVILDEAALPEVMIQDHYQAPGTETPHQTAARHIAHSPHFRSAGTLDQLAREIAMRPEALAATVADWNGLLRSGAAIDPLTGRRLEALRPLGQGRWVAVPFFPMLRKTLGGVATDLKCRVLDVNRKPIPGLFAAGELTGMGGGGMAGWRALEGLTAGGSLFSGRIAGRWAARLARRSRSGPGGQDFA